MRPIPNTATGEHCGAQDIFDRLLLGDLRKVGVEVVSTMMFRRVSWLEEELSGIASFSRLVTSVIIVDVPFPTINCTDLATAGVVD